MLPLLLLPEDEDINFDGNISESVGRGFTAF